ncbi:MAG TPA: (Fe-S)-binding protein, partial [Actinomycetes bacterium]|nr:(Fe-S)-binding protein [Actinomycetes bacterium]
MQVVAIVVALGSTVAAVVLAVRAVARLLRTFRQGQPDRSRTASPGARAAQLVRESIGHTRMARKRLVAVAHWPVMVGFYALIGTLATAYGQLFDPEFALPLIGHWTPAVFAVELIAAATWLGIVALIVVRQFLNPARLARASRFFGSRTWQGYFVEAVIVAIATCVLLLRGLEGALLGDAGISWSHPLSWPLVAAFDGAPRGSLETAVYLVAAVKILVSMVWLIVISLDTTMGVAWHRFTAFFNIFLKRYPDGRPSLGPLQPIAYKGAPVDFEDPPEDAAFGAGRIEDLSWKDLLDVTTCTECGRCQEQCPAWATGKPLSPKLFVMGLRDHAHARAAGTVADVPLVALAESGGVIDPDVLWSCVMCGACVTECPVDIEHVDHVVDLRRHQVLVESDFPAELTGTFRNLENKANPWGLGAQQRMAWADGLDFDVPVLGRDAEDAGAFDYLFWVGCAGAFEDRAKKTTRAVAELLHAAGVSFAVMGPAESCTGDPARRSGNEFVYQMLAQANVEALNELRVHKVVVTCPHCFTTIGAEYRQLGGDFDVVHHTELLDRLVKEGRLVPATPVDEKVTFHDPCFLGRHNQIYEPPRELLAAVPGLQVEEMGRNRSRSFCCGAGGGRMWMEERIGKRINHERVDEALALAPDTVAVGCPFCRVMLDDGVSDRAAAERTQVIDV